MANDSTTPPVPPAAWHTTPELDVDGLRADIAKAARMAATAASSALDHRQLEACTPNDRYNLIAQAVIAYLLGEGLATLAPDEAWQAFLPGDVPEPYRGDLLTELREASARQARINAALRSGE